MVKLTFLQMSISFFSISFTDSKFIECSTTDPAVEWVTRWTHHARNIDKRHKFIFADRNSISFPMVIQIMQSIHGFIDTDSSVSRINWNCNLYIYTVEPSIFILQFYDYNNNISHTSYLFPPPIWPLQGLSSYNTVSRANHHISTMHFNLPVQCNHQNDIVVFSRPNSTIQPP